MNLKVQSNGLPNIANISCCDFVVKFAQMQKVITSNLHLGQVENGMGLVIATQHCQKCHSRHEPQMWDEEIAGITQSCQVLLNSWLLSKYERRKIFRKMRSKEKAFELCVVMGPITCGEWFEWVDNWYRHPPSQHPPDITSYNPFRPQTGQQTLRQTDLKQGCVPSWVRPKVNQTLQL